MECDWEVEIGGDAPVIDACWDGFVDLRFDPESARELPEAADLPGLAEALIRLNGLHSPVRTSKCDVWPVFDSDLDADELDAPADEATQGWACYIDLLPQIEAASIEANRIEAAGIEVSSRARTSTNSAVRWCKVSCERLRAVPLTHCRVDLIVRQAVTAPEDTMVPDHGITAYLTACGGSSESANAILSRALKAFAHTISPDSTVE